MTDTLTGRPQEIIAGAQLRATLRSRAVTARFRP